MLSLTSDAQTIVLFFVTLLTGLSAGLCFTWTNAVTPGIGQLDNLSYLKSFQQMNRVIINPTFMVVFFGPLFLHIVNVFLSWIYSVNTLGILALSASLYIVGVIGVTIFGHVPLNERLDQADLEKISIEELCLLRDHFESRWNRLHRVRTGTGIFSFLLLLICIVLNSKNVHL